MAGTGIALHAGGVQEAARKRAPRDARLVHSFVLYHGLPFQSVVPRTAQVFFKCETATGPFLSISGPYGVSEVTVCLGVCSC